MSAQQWEKEGKSSSFPFLAVKSAKFDKFTLNYSKGFTGPLGILLLWLHFWWRTFSFLSFFVSFLPFWMQWTLCPHILTTFSWNLVCPAKLAVLVHKFSWALSLSGHLAQALSLPGSVLIKLTIRGLESQGSASKKKGSNLRHNTLEISGHWPDEANAPNFGVAIWPVSWGLLRLAACSETWVSFSFSLVQSRAMSILFHKKDNKIWVSGRADEWMDTLLWDRTEMKIWARLSGEGTLVK